MTNYIFIESRDPFDSRDLQFVEETATTLKQRGHEVSLFLVQIGVLACRRNINDARLDRLAQAGVTVLADDFSLRERGIPDADLLSSVRPSSIDILVGALVQENTKAIWH